MMKIGITGGIGSGKTTVCRIFEVLNIDIYYSDIRAKELMISHPQLMEKLRSSFGDEIFNPTGKLNTTLLASIVFSDPAMLKILNGIVHPFVLEDFSTWCNTHHKENYILLESAIIYESNIAHLLDHVIIVDAPDEIRIQRIVERDKTKPEDVMQRMRNQLSAADKIKRSKYIIINDGKRSLIDQVMSLHKDFSGI